MDAPFESPVGADRRPDEPGGHPVVGPTPVEVGQLIADWLDTGVISAEQAARMRADVASAAPAAAPAEAQRPGLPQPTVGTHPGPGPTPAAAPPPPRPAPALVAGGASLVTEALGYLGGVIILVAVILVTARLWSDLSTPARLALVAGATALLAVGGLLVPGRLGETAGRLRAVLWLASTAAVAGFLGLLGNEAFGWQDNGLVVFITGVTTVYAAVLWSAHHHLLQHIGTLLPLLGSAAAAASLLPAHNEGAPGLAAWGLAVVWGLLSWGGLLTWTGPPGPANAGVVLASVGAVSAGMTTMMTDWGSALELGTVAMLVGVAVLSRSLLLLAIGSLAALETLPATMVRYFGGTLAAALGLLVVGVVLVGAAIATARRRQRRPFAAEGMSPGHATLPWPDRTVALTASAVVAAGTLAGVLTLGLS